MRLTGGACACCGEVTGAAVLWAARVVFVRVWCCDGCVAHLGELERGALTAAAFELEQLADQRRGQSAHLASTPSA